MFKTPKFWYEESVKSAIISNILLPLSGIFIIGTKIRKLISTEKTIAGKFVICVGNVTLGGNGKTPVTLALFEELSQIFPGDICVISKGYGRKTKGFIVVENNMNPLQIGDEPALISQTAPIYLFTKIEDILQNIHKIKEKIILVDDGLQNPNFYKDFNLLVIGEQQLGNGKVFPAGPMRESKKSAFEKSDAIIFTGNGKELKINKPSYNAQPHFNCEILPQEITAFSGLGNNKKFNNSLLQQGFSVKNFFEFKDHHQYTSNEIKEIIKKSGNLPIVTTQKDWVKLDHSHKNVIHTLKIKYTLDKKLISSIIEEINLKKY